jgi:glycosyltransferase involved in cell wall biosynthesis
MTREQEGPRPAVPELSVILCTHNPRQDYLARVLEGLRLQSLPMSRWELIVVDSASLPPLAPGIDLSWHERSRLVREEEAGHLRARVSGIQVAKGPLLVFVDDDNVLAPDYLDQALTIARDHPRLGVWGGSAIGDYDKSPPAWFKPYEHVISVREITRDAWSNVPAMDEPWVIGAGMVVRKELAAPYADLVISDSRRLLLGRKGSSIMGADDLDFILSICDQGFGRGVFQSLRLSHLIPASRCEPEYLWNLAKCNAASMELIRLFRRKDGKAPHTSPLVKILEWARELRLPPYAKRYAKAVRQGTQLARNLLRDELSRPR